MTHRAQQQVFEFMEARGQPTPDPIRGVATLTIGRTLLRLDLIREEFDELVEASGFAFVDGRLCRTPHNNGDPLARVISDPLAQIDALCDLLYVTYGMAVEMGIDIEPFYEAVHAANMLKADGPVREDGKRLKLPGWKPPDLAAVYRRVCPDAAPLEP